MSRNPSVRDPQNPRKPLLNEEQPEPMTEEERQQRVLDEQQQRAHAKTSEIANRLRNLVDESSMNDEDKKPFLDLVNEMYKFGETGSTI